MPEAIEPRAWALPCRTHDRRTEADPEVRASARIWCGLCAPLETSSVR